MFEVLDSVEKLPDAIIVDPPRVGIQTKAVNKIAGYGVDEIVYISCNPDHGNRPRRLPKYGL